MLLQIVGLRQISSPNKAQSSFVIAKDITIVVQLLDEAVKSFLKFAENTGVLEVNLGVLMRPPKGKDTLTERILMEAEVATMIALETNERNFLILRLLYLAGLRVSELCSALLEGHGAKRRDGADYCFCPRGKDSYYPTTSDFLDTTASSSRRCLFLGIHMSRYLD